jgi:hypothetical protein
MRARDNPFRVDRVRTIRYAPDGSSLAELAQRFVKLGHRAALVGPNGSGKTTLMEDLAGYFAAEGWTVRHVRLSVERPRLDPDQVRELLAGLRARDLVLLDGANLLGHLSWWRFRRRACRAGSLLITSHRPGLLPTLWKHETSPELLGGIVAELLRPNEGVDAEVIGQLFERHGGNLREALRELYDMYARR